MERQPYHFTHIVSMMPPGDFEMANWGVDDGKQWVERLPLVGWALTDHWDCFSLHCSGERCDLADDHYVSRYVDPLWLEAGTFAVVEDIGDNGMLINKSVTDPELNALAEQEIREHTKRMALVQERQNGRP